MIDLKDLRKELRGLDKDDLLELVGLQTRRHAADYLLPVAGIFGVGLLVGAGLGLLLAPKPGRELREDLRHRLNKDTSQQPASAATLSRETARIG